MSVSLYELAMESGESIYNQDDATGFIRLNALRPASGIAAKVQKKKAPQLPG